MEIDKLVEAQRTLFATGVTKDPAYRKTALANLRKAIVQNESKLNAALKEDLHKSAFESYMCETGLVLSELTFMQRNLARLARPRHVLTPLAQFPGRSFVVAEPYGVTLIMSPWNYPLMLCLEPLIGALAAGNCAVLKPSAYAPATSKAIAEILSKTFPADYVAVVEGGREENAALLEQTFDYIFFTGGVDVGRLVMEKAAAHLTPVTLELGGKSPCIVDDSADLRTAAKRIVFGKFLNAGQTCVAPDYLFVHAAVKDELVEFIKEAVTEFFGADPLSCPEYGKIINQKHFERLQGLLEGQNLLIGGGHNIRQQIEPTLVDEVTPDNPLMQEEIFGPILPMMTFLDIREVIRYVNAHDKPLALYLFTTEKAVEQKVLRSCSFGGGCINDTVVHLATSRMGFGGVGASGMGSYHGKDSFYTFSHRKSILKKANWMDLPMRYHPYTEKNEKWLRRFLK